MGRGRSLSELQASLRPSTVLRSVRDPETGRYCSVSEAQSWPWEKFLKLSDRDAEYLLAVLPAETPPVIYGFDRGEGW